MQNLTPSQLDSFSREVAGQVAQGYSFDQVLSNLDLARHELDEIFDSEEFNTYLEGYGKSVIEAFKETRASSRAGSFHRKVSERFDTYYDELHELAMNKGLRPEKRADILLTLMKYVAPSSEKTIDPVRMPPDLVENWTRRTIEFYETEEKEGRGNHNPHGIGTQERDQNSSKEEPVLLRGNSNADDGFNSGATPTIRKFYPDEPVERWSGSEPEKTRVDASGPFQILDNISSIPALVAPSRPEHFNSTDIIEGIEHKEVGRRDSKHD